MFTYQKMYMSVMRRKCRVDLKSTETVRQINHQFRFFKNLSLIQNFVFLKMKVIVDGLKYTHRCEYYSTLSLDIQMNAINDGK